MSDPATEKTSHDPLRPGDPRRIELNITSDPANLGPVRHAVETFCLNCGFDAPSAGDIGLCVNEALANITRHAYDGAIDQPIHIVAQCQADELSIAIRDWGNGESPAVLPDLPHDPLQPGGIGLICLRQLMNQTVFAPQENGMLLTLTRKRKPSAMERANG